MSPNTIDPEIQETDSENGDSEDHSADYNHLSDSSHTCVNTL